LLEDLELGKIEFGSTREFLLKKKFGKGDKKLVKMAELKRMEQEVKTMEKFVQDFRRVVRDNRYKGRILVKEFKRVINKVIRRRLIEVEEKKRLRERKKSENQRQRQREMKKNQERSRP